MICPICNFPACITVALDGDLVMVYCRECIHHEVRHVDHLLIGSGDTEEEAIEDWLHDARALCASDQIPALPCPLVPRVPVVVEVLEQAQAEFERQRGFRLVEGITFERDDEYVAKRSLYLEIGNA